KAIPQSASLTAPFTQGSLWCCRTGATYKNRPVNKSQIGLTVLRTHDEPGDILVCSASKNSIAWLIKTNFYYQEILLSVY
ncbi:MAG: hypothetical protein ACI4JR_00005, partial [Acutalibacteraceae bacterium]